MFNEKTGSVFAFIAMIFVVVTFLFLVFQSPKVKKAVARMKTKKDTSGENVEEEKKETVVEKAAA